MTEHEDGKEYESGRVTVKINKALHEEIQKIADREGKGLRETIDNIFFAKLAIKAEQDGTISAADETLSVFQLAVKYLHNKDAIKYLIQAATLKYRQEQIALTAARIEKLKNSDKPMTITEYINKFCCPACDAKFDTAHETMSHFNRSHEREEAEVKALYLCPYCPTERMCSSAGALEAHMLTEHRNKFNPPPSPINRPVPRVPEVKQQEVVFKDREVTVHSCYCGSRFSSDMERSQHAVKCQWLQRYAEAQAKRVSS